jgi:hypothetical protein
MPFISLLVFQRGVTRLKRGRQRGEKSARDGIAASLAMPQKIWCGVSIAAEYCEMPLHRQQTDIITYLV